MRKNGRSCTWFYPFKITLLKYFFKRVFYFEPLLEWHTFTRNAVGNLHIFYVVCHSGTFFFLSCHNQDNHHDRTVNMNLIFPDDSCISVCLVIHNLTRWSQTTKYTAILLFPASLMLPFHNHSDFSPVPLFSPGRH